MANIKYNYLKMNHYILNLINDCFIILFNMISKERKIQILKNKIKYCEEKDNHKKIKEELKKELDKLVNN